MLKLNKSARTIYQAFGNPKIIVDGLDIADKISNSYKILIVYFLFNIQDNIEHFPHEVEADIYRGISRIYESVFWTRKALGNYKIKSIEPIDDVYGQFHRSNKLSAIYESVSIRLIKLCSHNFFLENSLIRLNNSYHVCSDVMDKSKTLDVAKDIVRRAQNKNS